MIKLSATFPLDGIVRHDDWPVRCPEAEAPIGPGTSASLARAYRDVESRFGNKVTQTIPRSYKSRI